MNEFKKKRQEMQLSINQLARISNISPQRISQLEALSNDELITHVGSMKIQTLVRLSDALSIDVDFFLSQLASNNY